MSPHPTIVNTPLVPFRTLAASALAPRSTGPPLLSSRQCQGNHRHGSTPLHTRTGPQPARTAARLGTGRNPFISCLGTVAHACETEVRKLRIWDQRRPQSKILPQNNRKLFTPGWQVKARPPICCSAFRVHGGRTQLGCGQAQVLCHFPTGVSSFLACLGSGVALCGRVSTHLGGK